MVKEYLKHEFISFSPIALLYPIILMQHSLSLNGVQSKNKE